MANTTGVTPGLLIKGLNEVFHQKYGEKTIGMIDSNAVMNFRTVTRGMTDTDVVLAGIGDFKEVAEQANIPMEEVLERGQTIYQHKLYADGFAISYKMMLADETGGNTLEMAAQLGQAARQIQEKLRMSVLVNGGTKVGLDGVPLFSKVHPLADGTVQANDIDWTTDLYTTVKLAISALRRQKSYNGKISLAKDPVMVLCPEALFAPMIEATKARNYPSATNSSFASYISEIFPGLQVGWNPYLGAEFGGSDDKFYVLSDKTNHRLKVFIREAVNTWNTPWQDNDNIQMEYKCKFAESAGFSDYMGVVRGDGTP